MTVEESVNQLDYFEFERCARNATHDLNVNGYTFVGLCPGDGTIYRIAIVKDGTGGHWMATEFGPMYPLNVTLGNKHWDYVAEKWLPHMKASQEWTARVLTRFLNTLCNMLEGGTS